MSRVNLDNLPLCPLRFWGQGLCGAGSIKGFKLFVYVGGGNKADVRPQNLKPSGLEGPNTLVFQRGKLRPGESR